MESNELIAEFMSMNYGDPKDNSVMIQMTPQGSEVVPINSMKYHSSWDWLMLVVQKCYKIDNEEGFDSLVDAVSTLDIDGTYQAVVEFIKNFKTI